MSDVPSDLLCDVRSGVLVKEFMEVEELPFAWSFTTRTSPEDKTPIMEKYDSYEERLKSFNSLKNFYDSKVKQLAKFGFYFSPKPNRGAIICFSCGRYHVMEEDAVIREKKLRNDYVTFYHHHHCPFMNNLVEKNYEWVKSSEKQVKIIPWDDVYEVVLQKVRKSIFESRAAQPKLDLETSNETLQQQDTCKVCQKKTVEVLFHPCAHKASCIKCAKGTSECPLCHKTYTGLCRTYMENFKHNVDPDCGSHLFKKEWDPNC